jgi:hypothetical protein
MTHSPIYMSVNLPLRLQNFRKDLKNLMEFDIGELTHSSFGEKNSGHLKRIMLSFSQFQRKQLNCYGRRKFEYILWETLDVTQ